MGKVKEKKSKHADKKKGKKHKKHRETSSSSSSDDEWVEKPADTINATATSRNASISLPSHFLTPSNQDRKRQKQEEQREQKLKQQYDPCSSVRELNPYWKNNGTGLPQFKKPSDEFNESQKSDYTVVSNRETGRSWKRKSNETSTTPQDEPLPETHEEKMQTTKNFSKEELNALAAQLVKAEIMGNAELINKLTKQLESARKSTPVGQNDVLLTQTNSRGYSRPFAMRKLQKVDYFANENNKSLKQMFQEERFNTSEKQNEEFLQMLPKSSKPDDFDEIFGENESRKRNVAKQEQRDRDQAISQHEKRTNSLDNCKMCPENITKTCKHLIIASGDNVFLSLPHHEPLVEGHCFLAPVKHVTCSTQLDENEWEDIMTYRRTLTHLFAEQHKDVVFFEMAKSLHRFAHMKIECVPIEKDVGDLAPIYFKKAIDESENEWVSNKKLIRLEGTNVRRAIPKGLPYFFVSFGMQEGFAHVIEDEPAFPENFAQEIIGGMLDLHHSKWRRPRTQNSTEQSERARQFHRFWSQFGIK